MTKVITLNGELINLGDWDYKIYEIEVINNPFPGPMLAPDGWDFQITYEEMIGNPLPEGAIEEDREIVTSAKGRLRFAEDWYHLREDAYPPIKDQLEAQWKGGVDAEEMAKKIAAIKEQYPKPE